MFSGKYSCTLDDKGRVHIPADIKKDMGGNKDLRIADRKKYLILFPPDYFERMGEELIKLRKDKKQANKVRKVFSSFYRSTIKNGKLLIPQEIRGNFKLEKKIQVVGAGDHIEIWNESDWMREEAGYEKEADLDDLDELGY